MSGRQRSGTRVEFRAFHNDVSNESLPMRLPLRLFRIAIMEATKAYADSATYWQIFRGRSPQVL